MRRDRGTSKKVVNLYLNSEVMNDELKQKILKVAPDYPVKYFEKWFKEAYEWSKGHKNSSAGPGTDYILGYLDAAKELNLNIDLVIEATQDWRSNKKREQAINDWLLQNN